VRVICPHIDRKQRPSAEIANVPDSKVDKFSACRIQQKRIAFKTFPVIFFAKMAYNTARTVKPIMKFVYRPSLIARQPCSVRAKRYQISDRSVRVIPFSHRHKIGRPLTQAVLTNWPAADAGGSNKLAAR